jgi:hypothetical protein
VRRLGRDEAEGDRETRRLRRAISDKEVDVAAGAGAPRRRKRSRRRVQHRVQPLKEGARRTGRSRRSGRRRRRRFRAVSRHHVFRGGLREQPGEKRS